MYTYCSSRLITPGAIYRAIAKSIGEFPIIETLSLSIPFYWVLSWPNKISK